MKHLILIGGTMGVGKTTVSNELKKALPHSVFVDGDWCWDMNPFEVNETSKELVLNNISMLLKNDLESNLFENVILCWVMHQQDIIDEIIKRINKEDLDVYSISLICDEKTLIKHFQKDIKKGLRKESDIEKSIERLESYKKVESYKIDVSTLTLKETVKKIKDYIK